MVAGEQVLVPNCSFSAWHLLRTVRCALDELAAVAGMLPVLLAGRAVHARVLNYRRLRDVHIALASTAAGTGTGDEVLPRAVTIRPLAVTVVVGGPELAVRIGIEDVFIARANCWIDSRAVDI